MTEIGPPDNSKHKINQLIQKNGDDCSVEMDVDLLLEMIDGFSFRAAVVLRKDSADSIQTYHPLQARDPEEAELADYRKNEVQAILDMLEDSNLVVLVGPSRSCKSEATLHGWEEYFLPENGLEVKAAAFYFDAQDYDGLDLTSDNVLEKMKQQGKESSKVILFDEFSFNQEAHYKIVDELINKGYKVVIVLAGRKSTPTKLNHIEAFSEDFPVFKEFPHVKVGIKPLNMRQLDTIFQKLLNKKKRQAAKMASTAPARSSKSIFDRMASFDEEQVNEATKIWELIKENFYDLLPLPFFAAENLITEVISTVCWNRDPEKRLNPSYWRDVIVEELSSLESGNIHMY